MAAQDGGFPFVNQDNDTYGVAIEATWFLKPREMVVRDFEWERPPDRLAELMIGRPLRAEPKVEVTLPEEETVADTATKIASATKDMSGQELLFWGIVILAVLAALVGIGPKLLQVWAQRRAAKKTNG